MSNFFPEGILMGTAENQYYLTNGTTLQEAMVEQVALEARALVCDYDHNLIVDLGCMRGIIKKEEGAIGIREGVTRDIAIISRVNKPVSFIVTGIEKDENGHLVALLSRKQLQERCQQHYIQTLKPGDIIRGRVTHLEPFGCFVDIGCGIVALIPINAISVSRISHPKDRFEVGQDIFTVVKCIEPDGKVCLSHKELLGTWEENAAEFSQGETVAGIVRSIEPYGIFVELTPNLAGLAEPKDDVRVGQHASVYIKGLLADKMKCKLIIVDSFDANYKARDHQYHITGPHIDYWQYSPDNCSKVIETIF